VQQPVNAAPVLLTQFLGGFQGHMEGLLVDNIVSGVTARSMRNTFKKWKRSPGDSYILYNIDEAMLIVPYNMSYKPIAKTEGVMYEVSFDFFEAD
jgi:hypothetical protein